MTDKEFLLFFPTKTAAIRTLHKTCAGVVFGVDKVDANRCVSLSGVDNLGGRGGLGHTYFERCCSLVFSIL